MTQLLTDRKFRDIHSSCNSLATMILQYNSDSGDHLRSAIYKFMIRCCGDLEVGYDDNDIATNIDDAFSMLDAKLASCDDPEHCRIDHNVKDVEGSPVLELVITVEGVTVVEGEFSVRTLRLLNTKREAQIRLAKQRQG